MVAPAVSEEKQSKIVALVGNPNCGKTTLFNGLTGSRYKVANYPGVTVERKEGCLPLSSTNVSLVDLPGTYALDGMSVDERIVTQFLGGQISGSSRPDLVVAVVDATNLERNLFLVSELIDCGYPLVLAVNMMDAAESQGLKVFSELLSRHLDLPVVPLVARSKKGLDELKACIETQLRGPATSAKKFAWLSDAPSPPAKTSEAASSVFPWETLGLSVAQVGSQRYGWIRGVVDRSTKRESKPTSRWMERADALLTSTAFGLPFLICLFALVFQAIFLWAQYPMDLISAAIDGACGWLSDTLPPGILTSLLTEGVVPGVGNVIIFVPQIAILFLFIGILEDCGYLSRAAFLLDNFMRRVGLQGRSFIPLLSSFACAVPGILSTRTIPSRSDRLATIMIAPLMSCAARLPVYAVLIGAFIPATTIGGIVSLRGLVLLGMYLLGIVGACVVAWVLKRFLLWREPSFYVMEMPPLRRPVFRVVLRGVYDSVLSFLKNATTVILACSIVIWFLASYPKPAPDYSGNPVQISYAGKLGTLIEPLIRPLGFNWEIGVGIISSFPAREVFVTGLSTVYNVKDNEDDDHRSIISHLQKKNADGSFPTATAVALMVFYVFACQCMSTLAVCRRETGSWRWVAAMFTYMTTLAYIAAFITYQVGIRL